MKPLSVIEPVLAISYLCAEAHKINSLAPWVIRAVVTPYATEVTGNEEDEQDEQRDGEQPDHYRQTHPHITLCFVSFISLPRL